MTSGALFSSDAGRRAGIAKPAQITLVAKKTMSRDERAPADHPLLLTHAAEGMAALESTAACCSESH